MTMKRILFVINTLGNAGAEKALIELLKKIDTDEYHIDLKVLLNQGELVADIPNGVHLLGSKHDECPVYGKEGRSHLIRFVFKTLFRRCTLLRCIPYITGNMVRMLFSGTFMMDKLLWKPLSMGVTMSSDHYDLAVAFVEGGSTHLVADRVNATKKVAFLHVPYETAGYSRSLDGNIYSSFDMICTVSDEVREAFSEYYPEYKNKVMVFHNILDIQNIKQKATCDVGFNDGYEGIRIISVGRLVRQKAYDVGVSAMKLIIKKGIDARWYVLGEGEERNYLEKKIEESGLEERFILMGNVANPYPYIVESDVFVHASRFDGKSIAIQEAQVLEKPIIVSDCQGNREQVTNGIDGIVCELTPGAVAGAVISILSDKEAAEKMAYNAYEKIERIAYAEEELKSLIDMIN